MEEKKQSIWKKDLFSGLRKFNLSNFKKTIKFFKYAAIGLVIIAALLTTIDEVSYYLGLGYYADDYEDKYIKENKEECNVSGIELRGEIVTYNAPGDLDEEGYAINETSSEDISLIIADGENNDSIKAILLKIDSWGGSPFASEEIASILKNAKKPTIALIREYGLSAAYLSATGADIIFASRNSDVGSIGVTMSYLQNVEKNKKDGLEYIQLSLGKFKDMGDPDKPLTYEEKQLFMRDVKILHENFIEDVAENRKLDIEKVRKLADGSSMLGEMALENGLIDKIGGFNEVEEYIKEIIGEKVEVCW